MSEKISRRDFLKLAGGGAAVSGVLTGCGPASRYVVRSPYAQMPEYNYNGQSTYYATTCRECAAACGLVVRTMQGRAIKVEGNDQHPVNLGKTCPRGQTTLQGLYNPDRVQEPARQNGRGTGDYSTLTWDDAIQVVRDALSDHKPSEVAFLLGIAPDHLFDLVAEMTAAMGADGPKRFSAYAFLEERNTLAESALSMFGQRALPVFDIDHSDVTFSFGADFLGTWLSPVRYTRGYASLRNSVPGRRGYLVHFEPRMSQTGAKADEWIPVAPGSEAGIALALGRLAAETRGGTIPAAYLQVDVAAAAAAAGITEDDLRRLAGIWADAQSPLAIPGGSALAGANGLETAKSVLMLDVLAENIGKPGGVFLTPDLPVASSAPRGTNSVADLKKLIDKMNSGQVKVALIHGFNPVFELPASFGFAAALAKVPLVISFASFPDETAAQADFIFPDHTALESWGYQVPVAAADRPVLSASQPVVAPYYNTRATADVLLAAVRAAGGDLAAKVPYRDEVEYLQHALLPLVKEAGNFSAPEINSFWAGWQQHGGWWSAESKLSQPIAGNALSSSLPVIGNKQLGNDEFRLVVYPSALFGDGSGANRPWLQETPDPMTTVMWNSWVEINPKTADELGLKDDDVVRISTEHGALETSVYRYPAIRPDVIALPFGQGHEQFGRYAAGRGANPAVLLPTTVNGAGDLAFQDVVVKIEKTGKTRLLARKESKLGVYGEE